MISDVRGLALSCAEKDLQEAWPMIKSALDQYNILIIIREM